MVNVKIVMCGMEYEFEDYDALREKLDEMASGVGETDADDGVYYTQD